MWINCTQSAECSGKFNKVYSQLFMWNTHEYVTLNLDIAWNMNISFTNI